MYSLPPRYLDIICVLVLCGILTAGLWPFFPPKNKVSWLKNEHGLLFGDYATVFSLGSLTLHRSRPDCTLELWLQPGLTSDSNTILDIYTPEVPFKFRVRQTGDDLALLRNYGNESDRSRAGKLYVDHVFRKRRCGPDHGLRKRAGHICLPGWQFSKVSTAIWPDLS